MKITKKKYLEGFLVVTLVLALVRCIFPSVAADRVVASRTEPERPKEEQPKPTASADAPPAQAVETKLDKAIQTAQLKPSRFFNADGTLRHSLIYSVPGYSKTFPDQQDVQYVSARQLGVKPVTNRKDAEHRKTELVYVGSNPYFYVDKLHNSIPYLVPRAAVLLQDIGQTFFDSLQVKGIPLHKVIVTSVLRTKEDVERLRGHNGNATENSCHLYGTTFDVCYNRYRTVEAPGEHRRQVRNDTLKYVLAEVLRDMRESGRCHIKYEVHQGCFHITVK